MSAWFQNGADLAGAVISALDREARQEQPLEVVLLRGKALVWQARFLKYMGLEYRAQDLFQQAIMLFEKRDAQTEMALALCYKGGSDDLYGDAFGGPACEAALNVFRTTGNRRGTALAQRGLAWATLHSGNYCLAKRYFQASLAIFSKLQDERELALGLGGLGYCCWILGEYEAGREYHEQMLALCREIDDPSGVARSLGDLGIDSFGLKQYKQAREFWLESLRLYQEIGDPRGVADELHDLGEDAIALGELNQALEYARQSLALMNDSDLSSHAWELRVLGKALTRLGDFQSARFHLRQALEQAIESRRRGFVLLTLVDAAELLARTGSPEYSAELLTLVTRHPASWQMARDGAQLLTNDLELKLPADAVQAARARGLSRDLDATAAEVIQALKATVQPDAIGTV